MIDAFVQEVDLNGVNERDSVGMARKERTATKLADVGNVDRILMAAEKVFSEKTFDGASLRDIAREADVPFSLSSYHFGSKEALFEKIIQRRSSEVVNHRRKLLLAARNASNPGSIPLEKIVHAYVYPFLERARSGGIEWQNYTRLISHTANSPRWSALISRHYDDVAQEFLSEFSRSLPDSSRSEIVYGFTFLVSSMLGVAARTQRSDFLSDGAVRSDDLKASIAVLIDFLANGFSRKMPPR